MEFYRHSGAVTLGGLIGATVAGVATAGVLGVVYAFLIVWIPLVFLNFLLTIGFGGILGFVVGGMARLGKVRNGLIAAMLGLICGLIGLYVAWAADPAARIPGEGFLFEPQELFAYISFFYHNGLWGFTDGAMVSGVVLAVVWILEALIIVGGSTLVAAMMIAGRPFCEQCYQWTTIEKDVRRLSAANAQQDQLERVLRGDLNALSAMVPATKGEPVYFRLDVARCPTCSQSNFLSIQAVSEGVDKEGKPTTNETAVFEHLVITQQQLALVRQAGREAAPAPPRAQLADDLPGSQFPLDRA